MVTSKERGNSRVTHTLFVWLRVNGQNQPQLWADDWKTLEDRMARVVFKHKLTGEDADLSLDELAKKYPAPEQKDG